MSAPFQFTAKAHPCKQDDQPMVGVWTDGIGVFSEASGHESRINFGDRPAYELIPGRTYRVTIEAIPTPPTKLTTK